MVSIESVMVPLLMAADMPKCEGDWLAKPSSRIRMD
jgi:hypothetical protein